MDGHCIRAHDQVAVDGGGDQHALAQLVGALEDDVVHTGALALVQQVVLATGGSDVEAGGLHHAVDFLGPDTGGIDDVAGFHSALGGGQAVAAVGHGLSVFHAAAAAQLHAVAHSHFGHGQGVLPGADDGGAGGPQGTADILGEVGLHGQRFFLGQNFHIGHAVGRAVLVQVLQVGQLALGQSQHEGAALLVGNIQLCADLLGQLHTAHVQPCHLGAGSGVVACVQNGAVGFGGAVGHVVFCLQNDDFVLVARQCVGCSGADHTTADDSNIIHYSFPPVSSALARREPGCCAVCTKKERTKTKA